MNDRGEGSTVGKEGSESNVDRDADFASMKPALLSPADDIAPPLGVTWPPCKALLAAPSPMGKGGTPAGGGRAVHSPVVVSKNIMLDLRDIETWGPPSGA